MEVREAVGTAKQYVCQLFMDEEIADVGLEEVEFDEVTDHWKVTIGFSRPWDQKNPLTSSFSKTRPGRSYKLLVIDDKTGHMDSLSDRLLNNSS